MNEEEEKKKFHEGLARIGATRVTGYSSPELKAYVNEDTRSIVTPTPVIKEDDAEVTPTGVDYLKQFVDEYTPKPLTEEEMNRRKKGAYVREGIGALGNAASAISNLIFTGKGAPSQTLPKNVDASAEIAKLEETEKAKRNEIYQRAKDRLTTQLAIEDREYKRKSDALKVKQDQAKLDIELKKLQATLAKTAAEIANLEAEGKVKEANALKAYYQSIEAAVKAKYAEQDMLSQISHRNAQSNNLNRIIPVKINGGASEFKVPEYIWKQPSTLGAIAQALGMDLRVEDTGGNTTFVGLQNGVPKMYTVDQLSMELGKALNDSSNRAIAEQVASMFDKGWTPPESDETQTPAQGGTDSQAGTDSQTQTSTPGGTSSASGKEYLDKNFLKRKK